ncbi:VOC family protein [Nonomuraea sp. NPDC050310]|uniref:VOC family protein n=1 Tax=unclassified Nonomuraea TaxID=2593643 RepID=UPI0033C0957D
MLRGPATVNLWADDMEAAKTWYSELLGAQPYFERPGNGQPAAYYEWRFGDYETELGIIDRRYAPPGPDAPGGIVLHWYVDDVQAALDRLLELGAKPYMPLTEQGPGFVTASVVDPFGNILGVMHNVHYQEVLGK